VVKIFPSDSNMLLVKFKEAKKLFDYLLSQKVIVRDRSNVVLCEDCLRLSVGTEVENEILLKAIESFV
jgi:histidinol-phosphate aminotransferase